MDKEFAGTLRERILIERPVMQRDDLGAASTQAETIGEYWAAIESMNAGQEAVSESRSAMQRWRFILRNTDSILPGDTLIWSDREMVVRMVSEDRRLLPKTILQAEEKR